MVICEQKSAQLVELWRAAFGEPPPVVCEEQFMLELIADAAVRCSRGPRPAGPNLRNDAVLALEMSADAWPDRFGQSELAVGDWGRTMGNSFNDHIARRIRNRRKELKLTLREVAETMGLSGQALFKYETGETRIPAMALWSLSQALRVSPGYFYEGVSTPGAVRVEAVSELRASA